MNNHKLNLYINKTLKHRNKSKLKQICPFGFLHEISTTHTERLNVSVNLSSIIIYI